MIGCLLALMGCSTNAQFKPEKIKCENLNVGECYAVTTKPLRTNADLLDFAVKQKVMIEQCKLAIDFYAKCGKVD